MNDQLQLIAAFLSQYVTSNRGGLSVPADPAFLKDGIRLLIEKRVMTAEEIKIEALKEYSVIIPYYLFPEEVRT